MQFIALLRGINVGGNNAVSMQRLREIFVEAGCEQVRTYINSGNVIFHDDRPVSDIQTMLDTKLRENFSFSIKLLLINQKNFRAIHDAIPDDWQNDSNQKCDVMFLWDTFNDKSILERLVIKPEVDNVRYINGALIWHVERRNVTKSGMMKLVGSELYRHMTIRNCNTVRKLQKILDSDLA